MRKPLTILLSFFMLMACSNDDDNSIRIINIRLSNISSYDFEAIIVNPLNQTEMYGNISSMGVSDYKTFQIAYRYTFIELQIDGETYTLQPIDYVGETPLRSGNYTYQIDANESLERYDKLSFMLIED